MRFMTFNKSTGSDGNHLYQDIDGIRLVYEPTKGKSQFQLVGWYRPDGWGEKAKIKYSTPAQIEKAKERDRNDPFC